MADSAKSASSFSFGKPATSGNSGGLFGQTPTSTPQSGGGLFGSSKDTPTTSATNPFGSTSIAGGSSILSGGGGGGSNLFGGDGNKTTGGFKFGQAQNNNASGGLFGSAPAAQQNNQPKNSAALSNVFGGFSTPNKPSETATSGQSLPPNVFGGVGATGTFSFSNLDSNTSSAAQANTTTPTNKPTTTLFGDSTTPAGPPPTASAGAGSGSVLFGKPPQDAGNPFANLGTSSSTQLTSSTAASSSGSSASNLGASTPRETSATASIALSPSIFGSTPSSGGSNLFGNSKRVAQPEGGLFNLNKAQDPGATKVTESKQPQVEPSKAPSLFANLGGQSTASTSTAPATGTSQPAFSFSKTNPAQAPISNTAASSSAATGFGLFGNQPSNSGAAAPSTSATSSSLFPNFGKPQDKATAAPADATSISAPTSSTPAPAPSLFGGLSNPATSSATPQAPAQPAKSGAVDGVGAANPNPGASTAGPPPPAQSRLKNKSMDEIITRWASDLSKYQKEFQKQADKVAAWDRMLVENSERIQKLYGSTLEAERATSEVERQLTAVENDQEELELWLDYYEKEVDAMMANQGGQGEPISGPDQERERTYQLASKVSERLDEMGKDLTSMIEEINDATSTLSKTGKADDPLTQVVRVLNNHLTQLQQIDQGAAALQLKVEHAQRTSQSLGPANGLSGPTSEAVEGFYRSYMGRR